MNDFVRMAVPASASGVVLSVVITVYEADSSVCCYDASAHCVANENSRGRKEAMSNGALRALASLPTPLRQRILFPAGSMQAGMPALPGSRSSRGDLISTFSL